MANDILTFEEHKELRSTKTITELYISDYTLSSSVTNMISNEALLNIARNIISGCDGVEHIFINANFNVSLNNNIAQSGTTMLLLTSVGLISINFLRAYGNLEGTELQRNWVVYSKEAECIVPNILLDTNINFITQFCNAIFMKKCMELSSVYVRNLICLDTLILPFKCNVIDSTTGLLSTQVILLSDLKSVIKGYIKSRSERGVIFNSDVCFTLLYDMFKGLNIRNNFYWDNKINLLMGRDSYKVKDVSAFANDTSVLIANKGVF